jgi:signal transduction histidine kinase
MNSSAILFEDLKLRIMNFIEKAKKAQESIQFTFEIDADLSRLELPSIVGMNVYRTIQESINNAIKYANAKQVDITIKSNGDQIDIKVSDDGIGFDIGDTSTGNGLLNMKKRIREIGGDFKLQSQIGEGTTVMASFPKPKSI